MVSEFKHHHGFVIREIIVNADAEVSFRALESPGRTCSFLLNDRVVIYIKHSAKRLPPWVFSYSVDNHSEIERLWLERESLWIVLACGIDGIVVLSYLEYSSLTESAKNAARFIRIDRDRRSQYRIFGNLGQLSASKPRGVSVIVEELKKMACC